MYLLFSFVLCRKMIEKKIHEKFHKSTLLPDVTDGTSPLLLTVTTTLMELRPFLQKGEGILY